MREMRPCWVCELEDCGHVWRAKSENPPALCAGCKRRGWNVTKSTAELIRSKVAPVASDVDLDARIEAIARRVFREELDNVPAESGVSNVSPNITADSSNVTERVPDLSAAPLADKLAVARAALASVGAVPAVPVAVVLGPCPYTEYVEDIGETMACGKLEHSWKIPHGDWRRV